MAAGAGLGGLKEKRYGTRRHNSHRRRKQYGNPPWVFRVQGQAVGGRTKMVLESPGRRVAGPVPGVNIKAKMPERSSPERDINNKEKG